MLEKTSRLYQICRLTSRKVAAILRIYFQHAFFPTSFPGFRAGRREPWERGCTLSSPVTFLTGNHVYKSDLTRSRLRLHQQEIWVRDKVKINVVVQFYPCFFICCNLGMVMYDNEFETKENKLQSKDKIEPQQEPSWPQNIYRPTKHCKGNTQLEPNRNVRVEILFRFC